MEIVVKTQKDFDKLPKEFKSFTYIEVYAEEHISINFKATNCEIRLRENSQATLWGNSQATLWGNSQATLRENSQATLWENSQATLRENSQATLWGNSQATLRENSQATLRENSQATGFDFSMLAVLSTSVVIKKLYDYSVLSARGFKPIIEKKHKTATVVKTPGTMNYTRAMFFERIESHDKDSVILYKSVRPDNGKDFQTNTIHYEGKVECPDFDPDENRECGGGLHLSPTPQEALSYNEGKLLKCLVKKKDIIVFSKNITKVRCKAVEVLGPVK